MKEGHKREEALASSLYNGLIEPMYRQQAINHGCMSSSSNLLVKVLTST